MSEINFSFIGWCNGTDKKTGVTSDKIWTAFSVNNTWYAGWGARGKTISFKQHKNQWELMKVKDTKTKKYDQVDAFQLFAIFPNFEDEVQKYLTFAVLANKIK